MEVISKVERTAVRRSLHRPVRIDRGIESACARGAKNHKQKPQGERVRKGTTGKQTEDYAKRTKSILVNNRVKQNRPEE